MLKEYNVDVQRLFLQMMLTNAELYTRVMNIMNSENFDKSLRPVAKFMIEYSEKYSLLPDSQQIKATTGQQIDIIEEFGDKHTEWFLQEFESFTKRQELERAILKSADLLEKGDYDPVEKLIKDFGKESFKFEIRRTFKDVTSARLWESKVLRRIKAVARTDFINRTDNKSIAPQVGDQNPAKRPEVREKISKSIKKWLLENGNQNIGRVTPEHVKEKQRKKKRGVLNPFYGKTHTKQNIELFSKRQTGVNNSFYNKKHSEETLKKIGLAQIGIPKPKAECPHCGKIGGINTMSRWHFDKCKIKRS